MLAILSPAKTLDFETPAGIDQFSKPEFLAESKKLISRLRQLSEGDLAALMSISPKLAALNHERFQQWKTPFSQDNAKQALLAFKGEVYTGFDLAAWDEEDFAYAQDHLRILSGLHGVLRPLDLIQPYRLEMGTDLPNERGKNLHEFWGPRITKALNKSLNDSSEHVIVNLASNEYFSAIQRIQLNGRVITPMFKDLKNGKYKFLTFYGKKARGCMADFIVRERLVKVEDLKAFRGMGYRYNKKLSEGDDWTFTRDKPE
jgi:cytoplasmic iron level regulating protein YaaA (DUF328/UPF0246 family)